MIKINFDTTLLGIKAWFSIISDSVRADINFIHLFGAQQLFLFMATTQYPTAGEAYMERKFCFTALSQSAYCS